MLEFCYGKIPGGSGAQRNASIITIPKIFFLFSESGEISSSGFASGLRIKNTSMKMAIIVYPNTASIPILA